jgi:hypothetical protein
MSIGDILTLVLKTILYGNGDDDDDDDHDDHDDDNNVTILRKEFAVMRI